jgi:signal transduction histidine kinase
MDNKLTAERTKPFRLVKYFTFTGLIMIFFVTIILSILNTQLVRSMQRQNSEEYAHVLIENLNHQIFLQFMVPVVMKYDKIKLSNKDQADLLDKVVRNTLHSFKVEALNIYSNKNIITYSFDQDMIGRERFGGTGFQQALTGKSTSKLIQRGNSLQIMFGFPKEVRLITFAPLRGEYTMGRFTSDVLGIVEIEQDLSQEYEAIFRIQILVISTSTVLMGVLYVVLIFVVKRGEGIIQKRAMERLQLKERLSQAEKLSAIGVMAAGISHEIRNPLGIIRSSAELLKKKVIQHDPTNTIPDIIVEESTRLNQIITEFINYAKPTNPTLAPCVIAEVIDKNLNFLASQIEEDGYIIKKNYQNAIPEIAADASMLYQSFLNILINAMQSMPDGGRIQIDASSKDDVVTVHFEDEGPGIPEPNLEKIWDPFFTTKERGSGLGLGIVKNIIEAHNGSIQISNREVRGARVTIELPVI